MTEMDLPTPQPKPHEAVRGRDMLLLVFSLGALLVFLGRGIYLVVTAYVPLFSSLPADEKSNIYGGASMLLCALLLLPVVILTLRRLRGRSINLARIPLIKAWQLIALIAAWVLSLFLSGFLGGLTSPLWLLSLPFFLLGIALPIAALVWIAGGGIPTCSWRRLWATLGISFSASTVIALGLELLAAVIAAALVGAIAVFNPGLKTTLTSLMHQLRNSRDMQSLMPLLEPYLTNPLVFLGILLFISGIGPLVEEAVKPLAVWLVGRHLRSTAEGFFLGALCGAGFALLEGMLYSSGAADMLGVSVAARATSSLMHITASGLMGWGIASALLEKRYGRLALVYLLSTAIHAFWNGSVLLAVFGGLRVSTRVPSVDVLGVIASVVGFLILVILFISILIILPAVNHRLRSSSAFQAEPIQSTIS